MSYWNEIEAVDGIYNFAGLDAQIEQIKQAGGQITMCLGVKQPRWPEYHWPAWTSRLAAADKTQRLLLFIQAVVERYQAESSIVSWQLENEALLRNFGEAIAIDRRRLRQEFKLVQALDPSRPIIMSTSNGWGIPLRRPRPDIVGFSYYGMMYKNGGYHRTIHRPWLYKMRKWLIAQPVFIHELQCEPWGPRAIWEMSLDEQFKSMSAPTIKRQIADAQSIQAGPIDLWGGEWWCWLATIKNNSDGIIAVRESVTIKS